jgi:hypothetical protein
VLGFRVPLGAFWIGECRAAGAQGVKPDEDTQLDCCNFGYSRGRCPRFPAAAEVDAVRFTRRGEQCLFILEKEHYPAKFGPLNEIEPGSLLEKQAQAWIST